MKIVYENDKKIKLFNNLFFYNLLYLKDTKEDEFSLKEVYGNFYKVIVDIQNDLKNFKDKIDKLYENTVIHRFVTNLEILYDSNSIDDYLKKFKSMPLDEVRYKLKEEIISVIKLIEGQEDVDFKDYNLKYDDFISYKVINKLPLEENYKWNLLEYLDNPSVIFSDLENLLRETNDIFEKYYPIFVIEYEKNKLTNKKINEYLANFGSLFKGAKDEVCLTLKSKDFINVIPLFLPNFSYSNLIKNKVHIFYGIGFDNLYNKLLENRFNMNFNRLLVLKSLSDPSRYEVIKSIVNGNKIVKEIAKELDLSSATVSHHIGQLVNSNILSINWRKENNEDILNKELIENILKQIILDFKLNMK